MKTFNPFHQKPKPITDSFQNWKQLYPKPYNKYEVDPYTKTRIILMNGTEFEANWFSHQFQRHVCDTDLRRELALTREIEKQQQLKIALLKPCNETALEHTIGYEQLAVDCLRTRLHNETCCLGDGHKVSDDALVGDGDRATLCYLSLK